MSYVDALWLKIVNIYSKWPPSAHTRSLSLCGHISIELRNKSTGKSAATFRRDCFILSILECVYLQAISWSLDHNLKSKGFWSEFAEGQSEVETKSGIFASCHCWVVSALCVGVSPAGNSGSVHGRGCCKVRLPNIESLKRFLRKAAADFRVDVLHNSIDEWPQRLKDCVHAIGGHFE